MMCHHQLQGMCLVAVAWLACPWMANAARDGGTSRHIATDPVGDKQKTMFDSCICEIPFNNQMLPFILVTQHWDMESGSCDINCNTRCQKFNVNATMIKCLNVRTANGDTGTNPALHVGLRPNIVDPSVKETLMEDMTIMKMVRHHTYSQENVFFACSCKNFFPIDAEDLEKGGNIEEFLFGDKTYYGGLQVWGRVGCDKSCSNECGKFGGKALQSQCIIAMMTKQSIEEEATNGLNGYNTVDMTTDMSKKGKGRS